MNIHEEDYCSVDSNGVCFVRRRSVRSRFDVIEDDQHHKGHYKEHHDSSGEEEGEEGYQKEDDQNDREVNCNKHHEEVVLPHTANSLF